MTCKIGILLLLITAVYGLQWFGPRETISASVTADWTPAPTATPEVAAHELFKRLLYPTSLCGWQGPDHEGAYCGSASYCAWVTDISVVGCCSNGGNCDAVYTSCIDTRDASPTGPAVPGVMTCNKLCYRNRFPLGYIQYGCGTYSTGQDVVTWFTGANPSFSLFMTQTGGVLKERTASTSPVDSVLTNQVQPNNDKSTSKSGSDSIVTSSGDIEILGISESSASSSRNLLSSTISTRLSASSSAAPSSSASPTPNVNDVNDAKKGISMGAMIAISVVAAVVAILAIALLVFCVVRRRRKQQKAQHFLSTSTGGNDPPVAQYDQPIMGTRKNPIELYQDSPIQSKEAQFLRSTATPSPQYARDDAHTNSLASSYELDPTNVVVQKLSPQSAVSISTFPSPSITPHPHSLTSGPTMSQYSHTYELPTERNSRVPELDNPEAQQPIMYASYGRV